KKSDGVGIESDQLLRIDLYRIDRAHRASELVALVHLPESGSFVRDGEIQTNKIVLVSKRQRICKLLLPHLQTCILHGDSAVPQRRVLHLRRERMFDRVAKNADANWRIDFARGRAPVS